MAGFWPSVGVARTGPADSRPEHRDGRGNASQSSSPRVQNLPPTSKQQVRVRHLSVRWCSSCSSRSCAPRRPPRDGVAHTAIDVLESAGAAPVVFVAAGPGWGKTTLLAQWAAASERPFACVDVDETDNDPIVLLSYIAVAPIASAPLDPRVFDSLATPGASVEGDCRSASGAALATIGRPVVLVLDDLHLVDDPAALDAVAALARHVPDASQLVLSARASLIPLGALRARGLAIEIGPDDLRMDEAEASQLMSAAGLELADEQISELTEHTEGWSAGLYLAALSINARGIPPARGDVLRAIVWSRTICSRSCSPTCPRRSFAS